MATSDFQTRSGLQVNGQLIYAAGGQSNVGIGNNAPDATLHVEGTINAVANATFGQWTVGNSTVNSFANSTVLTGGNSTVSFTINSSSISVANGFFTGQVNVGANVLLTTSAVTLGNSTANYVANSTNLTVINSTANVVVTPAQIQVGANAFMNATTFNVGNTTNYATVNTAGFTTTGNLSGTQNVAIAFHISGGGAVLTTGTKGAIEIPFPFTINRWTVLNNGNAGNVVISVWWSDYAHYSSISSSNAIIGTETPNTSGTTLKNQSTTLAGWKTTFNAGDILLFNVVSAATVIETTISLKGTRT